MKKKVQLNSIELGKKRSAVFSKIIKLEHEFKNLSDEIERAKHREAQAHKDLDNRTQTV